MKLRNQLLALFCLLLFISFGVLYFRSWVVQRPFGIILILCDGLTPGNLSAARIYGVGAGHQLAVEEFDRMALLTNASSDHAVPDAAAAASALATGAKVNNGSVAVDAQGRQLDSIIKLAKKAGRTVGIVTDGVLTSPGLAPFYAHGENPQDGAAFALQLIESDVDVIFGGGGSMFLPESKGGARKDGRDLLLEMRDRGDELVRSRAEMESVSPIRTHKVFGTFASGILPQPRDEGATPGLSELVRRAIQLLQFNQRGYLLIVDAGQATAAAQENRGEAFLGGILEADAAARIARQYAGEKSYVLVAGRNAIGGFSLNGTPLRQDHGVAITGKNAFGYPSITWASGPSKREDEPAQIVCETALPAASDMLVLGVGQKLENLKGFMHQTELFEILKKGL